MVFSIINAIFCAEPRKKPSLKQESRTEEYVVPANVTKEKFLVLDLDLTLVHCKRLGGDILGSNGEPNTYRFSVTPRPYLQNFMEELSKHYTIIIYTSSSLTYALSVVKFLKIGDYIKHLLHREHCVELNGQYIKDITMLNTPFSNTILIDDARSNYLAQPANCFPIEPFEGNKDDQHLLDLIPFLQSISKMPDVRNVLTKHREYLDKLSQADSIGQAKFSGLVSAPLLTEANLDDKTSSDSTASSLSSDEEKSPRAKTTIESKELTKDSEFVFKVNKALKEQCYIRIHKILRPYSSSKSGISFF